VRLGTDRALCGPVHVCAGVSAVLMHRLNDIWSSLRIPALARLEASAKYAQGATTAMVRRGVPWGAVGCTWGAVECAVGCCRVPRVL
jgi:hypothetical protein